MEGVWFRLQPPRCGYRHGIEFKGLMFGVAGPQYYQS